MNVSVLNLAHCSHPEISVLDGLTEGDNPLGYEFSGDRWGQEDLVYAWDSSHRTPTLTDKRPAISILQVRLGQWRTFRRTWTFTLTVTDDDGESTQAEIIVLVAEACEGILESITSTVGTTTAVIIGLLGIIIVGLVIFLLFTWREPSAEDYSMFDQSQYATAKTMAARCGATSDTCASRPSGPFSNGCCGSNVRHSRSTRGPRFQQPLPEGWTMEQWNTTASNGWLPIRLLQRLYNP